MDIATSFLQATVIVPLTLLPIINPLSGAPVFLATAGRDPEVIQRLARQVAINCWFVLVASMLVGTYVLDLFGISLPIVRIAGGFLVAVSQPTAMPQTEIVRLSFFPITFPLTTGPGTIAASIALGAKLPSKPALYVVGVLLAVLGAAITALTIYLVYRHSATLLKRLGDIGTLVMMRLAAFILFCIGIEIIWTGWAELNQLPR